MTDTDHGSGLRMAKCLRIRIKDVDLAYKQIVVRDGKGAKDRVTVLADESVPHLETQMAQVSHLMKKDTVPCGQAGG